jgi:hypothetical protein
LISTITNTLKEKETSGAAAHENAMLAAVQDLTAEIRAFREVFMTVVSGFSVPLTLDLTNSLQE